MKRMLILMAVLAITAVANAALQDGLLLYCPYDSTGGATTIDASGNGYNGTLYDITGPSGVDGSKFWTDGKFGNALRSYGTGDQDVMDAHYINDRGHDDGNVYGEFTTSFWVRRPSGNTNDSRWLTSFTLNDGNINDEGDMNWWGWGDLQWTMLETQYNWNSNIWTKLNDGATIEHQAGNFADSQWHNVVMVGKVWPQDGSGNRYALDYYVDGMQLNRTLYQDGGWPGMPFETIIMGVSSNIKGGADMNDDFDELAVWTRALSAEEVNWVATSNLPISQAPVPEPATIALLGLGALGLIHRKK